MAPSKKTTKPAPAGDQKEITTATPSKKTAKPATGAAPSEKPRLKERYHKEIASLLSKEFSYKNPMQIPRLAKIVLNVGMGEAISNVKLLDAAAKELALLTGQHPV